MIDYREYPPNWLTEIRPRILERARNRCEWCGVENGANVAVRKDGNREVLGFDVLPKPADTLREIVHVVRVVLTVAHLDHDKLNHAVTDNRLAALCQRCHLNYDRPHHMAVQKGNRERRKGPLLFDDDMLDAVSYAMVSEPPK